MKRMLSLLVLIGAVAGEAQALEAETVKVTLYRKGESIAGEEFIVMNETIIDYLATLKRPTETFGRIQYSCQVKSRAIRPDVYSSPSDPAVTRYVWVNAVYDLRDCVEIVPPPKP